MDLIILEIAKQKTKRTRVNSILMIFNNTIGKKMNKKLRKRITKLNCNSKISNSKPKDKNKNPEEKFNKLEKSRKNRKTSANKNKKRSE